MKLKRQRWNLKAWEKQSLVMPSLQFKVGKILQLWFKRHYEKKRELLKYELHDKEGDEFVSDMESF